MDNYYESWSIPKLATEIINNIKNAAPWDLTFAPTTNLTKEQKQELQDHLKYHFELWASTLITPQAEAILSKATKYRGK